MSLRFVLYVLGTYFFIRFITGFVIPLFRVGQGMRQHVKREAEKAEVGGYQNQRQSGKNAAAPARKKADGSEYIDFEELS